MPNLTCKIAVVARKGGNFNPGDCIKAPTDDLGKSVEEVGGNLRVIEITNADKTHPLILKLTQQWLIANPEFTFYADVDEYKTHPLFARQYYLEPVTPDNPLYEQFRITGRVSVTIEQLETYLRVRDA